MKRCYSRKQDIILISGIARNKGCVDALNRNLGSEVKVPDESKCVSALGAALTHD